MSAEIPSAPSSLTPTRLLCRGLARPQGIDEAQPRLSWISVSSDPAQRGQVQTAYQILVAETETALGNHSGNLWDSGKVMSDQSTHVAYAGTALQSHQFCFWKVRVWDREDAVSDWSEPGAWTMGFVTAPQPASAWTDYTVQIEFTLLNGAAGLFFRSQDASNGYMWQVKSDATLKLHTRTRGGYAILDTIALSDILTGDWMASSHELKVVVDGSEIRSYVDGVLVDTRNDTTFASGSVGFRESATESAVFRRITVTERGGQTLFEDHFPAGSPNAFTAGTLGPNGLTVAGADAMLSGVGSTSGWQPSWIGSTDRTPMVRKEFTVSKPVKRAWVYASALGIYELRLNGQKVGDDLFAPGWTDYRARVQYQRYDITDRVQSGANAVGAVLAPGWFAGNMGWFGINKYGSYPRLAAQIHVAFTDGTKQIVDSDASWNVSSGPLTASDIQDGDVYDARLEKTGWDQPGYDDAGWQRVSIDANDRNLVAQVDPPVGVIREITPVSVNEPTPGLFVYDMGQNFTGVVRIRVQGARGTPVTLQHAERLNSDGTLDRSNLTVVNATAEATDTYILKGAGAETFQPPFTFHGFQYVSVQGLDAAPALADVTGVVIGNRLPETGTLNTFDDALNKLLSNIKWTAHNAWVSIPMDCPQRAERLGWAGDMNVMAATAPFFFDMWRSYAKWQTDLLDAQATNGGDREGLMSNVAPKFPSLAGGYGGGWGDVGVNLPYITWKRYGDTRLITQSYEGMQKWLTFLERVSSGHIVPGTWAKAADWQNVDDATNNSLVATAYFALDAAQMAEMAAAIGRTVDAAQYQTLFEKIRTAFINQWVAADGTVANGSQTAYVFALQIGLLPENLRPAAAQKLVDKIRARQNHLSTGYLGTQWLLGVLTAQGYCDLAYTVLQQTGHPSWLYMTGLSTTMWESWNSLNPDGTFGNPKRMSLNHQALGSVGDWMYQTIGGLVPDAAHPGFKHFMIQPQPGGTLRQAAMTYQSPYGLISSNWALHNNRLHLTVDVPVNTTAVISLPTTHLDDITENGLPASSSPRVVAKGLIDGRACYQVGSGQYSFVAILNPPTSLPDLSATMYYWLMDDCYYPELCYAGEWTQDGLIDLHDFREIARHWVFEPNGPPTSARSGIPFGGHSDKTPGGRIGPDEIAGGPEYEPSPRNKPGSFPADATPAKQRCRKTAVAVTTPLNRYPSSCIRPDGQGRGRALSPACRPR